MNEDLYYESSSSISNELLDLTFRHSPWLLVDADRMTTNSSELDIRTKLKENAIQTFSDIFISSQLNEKNKIQLSNHLLLHAKKLEETMQVQKKKKKNRNEGISKDRKFSKLISISSAAYIIALGLIKKKTKDINQTVFGNLEQVLKI